ncbi:MAG: hypothetical protein ACKOA3_06675 [Sphingomonadales bacterium]
MRKKDLFIISLMGLALVGCQKQIAYQTAEDKLADKRWYLEKKNIGQQAYLYSGVSTFSFRLTKNNKSYSDSDGITGTYLVTEQPSAITLSITAGNRQIEAYQISLLEKEQVILEHTKNNVLNTFYFATRP